jgi:lysozyme family protein
MKTEIINEIIRAEGGYVNDPSDSGGETNFGITEGVARAFGYTGDMRDMPRATAFDIYAARYWDAVRGDELAELSAAVTFEVVDTGVNMGQARAVTFLQRALNVLNVGGRLYPDLTVDGLSGPMTIAALRQYLDARDEGVLLKALNCLQGAAYIELAERREKDERFVYGWMQQRVKL